MKYIHCIYIYTVYKYTVMLLLLLLSCFSRVRLCATPQMAAHKAPLSLGFSRQGHWSGLPFSSCSPFSLRIFQVVVIYRVKGFSVVNEAEVDIFLNSLAYALSSTLWNTEQQLNRTRPISVTDLKMSLGHTTKGKISVAKHCDTV